MMHYGPKQRFVRRGGKDPIEGGGGGGGGGGDIAAEVRKASEENIKKMMALQIFSMQEHTRMETVNTYAKVPSKLQIPN